MPRAIWTGSLSFGLVNVPVGLFSATDDKAIHFNQFQAGHARPHPPEARQRAHRGRGRVRGRRQGIRPRRGRVRDRHARGARVGGAGPLPDHRDHRLRRPRRHRPHLLQVDVLPGAPRRAGGAPLRPAARGDGAEQQGGRRLSRAAHQGAPGDDQADASRCWPSRPCTSPTRSATR